MCLSMPSYYLVFLLLISSHLSRNSFLSTKDSFSRSTSSLPLINTMTWQAVSSNKSVHISTLDACVSRRSQLKRQTNSIIIKLFFIHPKCGSLCLKVSHFIILIQIALCNLLSEFSLSFPRLFSTC